MYTGKLSFLSHSISFSLSDVTPFLSWNLLTQSVGNVFVIADGPLLDLYIYFGDPPRRPHWIAFSLAGSNLVGKFTQSVRRIVQDVKDEGTASEFATSNAPDKEDPNQNSPI